MSLPDDDLYELTLAWLTVAWRMVRNGQRKDARLFLGVDDECMDALATVPVTMLRVLARSRAITFRPRTAPAYWRFVAGTEDPGAIARYTMLVVSSNLKTGSDHPRHVR